MREDLQKLIDNVITASAKSIHQTEEAVKLGGRHRDLIRARHIGWMIIADQTADVKHANGVKIVTLDAIGKAYGGFNHASVLHGIGVARSKVWGDGINPPLVRWTKTYEDILNDISSEIAAEATEDDPRNFFPYTARGHALARRFLRDIGRSTSLNTPMEQIIIFANGEINKYRA
jgi:hypothetical protein